MQKIELLEEGHYYHIYNRGINRENIFNTSRDYKVFLDRFQEYVPAVVDVFSYSLLPNHFHSMVYVKKDVFVKKMEGNANMRLLASRQLGHCFNSYAQSFNRSYDRTGGLFQKPFKRKYVEDKNYFNTLVMYIHNNPKRHGFVDDFKEWTFTSYHEILSDEPTFLQRNEVLQWFGGKEAFIQLHEEYSKQKQEEDERWHIE